MLDKALLEEKRVKLVYEKSALLNICDSYVSATSSINGMPIQTLVALAAQGQALLADFEKFNYRADERFVNFREVITQRVAEINEAIEYHHKSINDMWDAIRCISSLDDARCVRAKIQSLLSSGLTETERSDLEEADKVIANFLENVEALSPDVNAEQLEKQYQELLTAFEGGPIDFRQALHSFYIKRYNEIALCEKNWCERWLVIDPEAMTQTELDAWKASTLVMPTYLSAESRAVLINLREAVEKALSKQRIDYILMLFSKLTEGEKMNCLAQLSNIE